MIEIRNTFISLYVRSNPAFQFFYWVNLAFEFALQPFSDILWSQENILQLNTAKFVFIIVSIGSSKVFVSSSAGKYKKHKLGAFYLQSLVQKSVHSSCN